MGASRPNVSSALHGDERVLTDRFIERFNAAFDGIFNTEWLLTGEGEMLTNPQSSGDNSPNIHGDGNSVHITTDGVLAERVKYLEALLDEKERLIRIYEKLLDK